MICDCGFKFSGAGEYRNHNVALTENNQWVSICPECKAVYGEVKR